MSEVVFVDTETTGLDPDRHEIWEVGLIVDDTEYEWFLPVDLSKADPMALNIGRFHERWVNPLGADDPYWASDTKRAEFAAEFVTLTNGKHLAGAVVSFDEERLRKLLRVNGQAPMWHYHLIDVEALAAGYLHGASLPWDSEKLSQAVGVDPTLFDRHTALGDARWAKAIYEAVTKRS